MLPETPKDWLTWAIARVRGQAALGRLIGVDQQVVHNWLHKTRLGVPAEYCQAVEDATGVPKHKLRPDLFPSTTSITTTDGTVIVCDIATGITASGRTINEAMAELGRLLAVEEAA